MCTEAEHKTHKLLEDLKTIINGRPFEDDIKVISTTTPYVLDYKERKRLYLFSSTFCMLTLEDGLGNVLVPANRWVDISFSQGMRIFANQQVTVLIRAIDESIDDPGIILSEGGITALIAAGQGYSLSLGDFTSGASTNQYPVAVFNPASNKNIFIYSIIASNGSGGATALLQRVTSNPGFTQTNPTNQLGNGTSFVSAIQNTCEISTSNQALSGNFEEVVTLGSGSLELLTNGAGIFLPKGVNSGLVAYLQTFGAGINSLIMRWVEL